MIDFDITFSMLILGLTGGIATGKSSASGHFKSQGIPVVDADQLARAVVEPGRPAYIRLLQQFGHLNILQSDGRQLDRKRLGDLVFANEAMRKQLNRCTHGDIRREALKELIGHFFQLQPLVIWDIPLLFEVGLDRYLSHTLMISCDQTTQLNRLKQRDRITDDQQALQRINAQLSLNEKCRRASHVIDNSGTKDVLQKELKQFLSTIRPSRVETFVWFIVLCVPLAFVYGFLRLWDSFDRIKYRNRWWRMFVFTMKMKSIQPISSLLACLWQWRFENITKQNLYCISFNAHRFCLCIAILLSWINFFQILPSRSDERDSPIATTSSKGSLHWTQNKWWGRSHFRWSHIPKEFHRAIE